MARLQKALQGSGDGEADAVAGGDPASDPAGALKLAAAVSSCRMLKPDAKLLGDTQTALIWALQLQLTAIVDVFKAGASGGKWVDVWRSGERDALGCSDEAATWAREAVGNEAFNKSFQLGRGRVDLMLRVVQLRAENVFLIGGGAEGPAAGGGGGEEGTKKQLELINKVGQL